MIYDEVVKLTKLLRSVGNARGVPADDARRANGAQWYYAGAWRTLSRVTVSAQDLPSHLSANSTGISSLPKEMSLMTPCRESDTTNATSDATVIKRLAASPSRPLSQSFVLLNCFTTPQSI